MGGGAAERAKAQASLERLKHLMADGYSIKNSDGQTNTVGRWWMWCLRMAATPAGCFCKKDWPKPGQTRGTCGADVRSALGYAAM